MVLMCKSKILFFVSIFALATLASANTCTDAWFNYFKRETNPHAEVHFDSAFHRYEEQFYMKNIFSNGRITEKETVYEDTSITRFYYYDSNESVLKKNGREYIVSECEAIDTLCYVYRIYENGLYTETDTAKQTSNYVVEYGPDYHFEFILKKDSIIQKYQYDIDKEYAKTSLEFVIADSNDDFKCIEIKENGLRDTLLYKPTENGFSITILDDSYINEFFFVKSDNTTTIRKTVKPVKIAPKARYFDLLGRYKFSK